MTRIFPRFIKGNRGDIISRLGFLEEIVKFFPADSIAVAADNDIPEGINMFKVGILKDLMPAFSQIKYCRPGNAVIWACGHDLTDEASALLIPHMMLKFIFYRLCGMDVQIAAQGAGPVKTALGKLCVKIIMCLIKSASFRDAESLALIERIAPEYKDKCSLTADTALLAVNNHLERKKTKRIIGVNLRRWHHFARRSIIPYEFKARLGLGKIRGAEMMKDFTKGMAVFLDRIINEFDFDIRFLPMYGPSLEPWEDDGVLCEDTLSRMENSGRCKICNGEYAPVEFINLFSDLYLMLGVRLHSTIIAAAQGVPSIHFGYSPKGFSFFKRIDSEKYCIPLESLTVAKDWDGLFEVFSELIQNRDSESGKLEKKINGELIPAAKENLKGFIK